MQDLDLNNYMTAGLYASNQNDNYTNVPSGMSENRYFALQVIRETTEEPNCYRQILYKYRDNTIYYRDYRWDGTGGFSWSEWEQLATKSDLANYVNITTKGVLNIYSSFTIDLIENGQDVYIISFGNSYGTGAAYLIFVNGSNNSLSVIELKQPSPTYLSYSTGGTGITFNSGEAIFYYSIAKLV